MWALESSLYKILIQVHERLHQTFNKKIKAGCKHFRTLCVIVCLSFLSCQEDEVMPAKFDENSLIWVAADQPVKDNSFLSSKILELCADLPIFWLRPTYPKGGFFIYRKWRILKGFSGTLKCSLW